MRPRIGRRPSRNWPPRSFSICRFLVFYREGERGLRKRRGREAACQAERAAGAPRAAPESSSIQAKTLGGSCTSAGDAARSEGCVRERCARQLLQRRERGRVSSPCAAADKSSVKGASAPAGGKARGGEQTTARNSSTPYPSWAAKQTQAIGN